MVERRRHPMNPRDFSDMMAEIEEWFASAMEAMESGSSLLPAGQEGIRVDVLDHGDMVIVVADLPGMEREGIAVRLQDPRTLEIIARRPREPGETAEEFFLQERIAGGSLRRIVLLPANVTVEGARATFRNGVLELTLQKDASSAGGDISVG
ncbi:MAG: Hsp20/alpha crystallin family protein [Methanomicrobiaceae archaeon]|nr:Hsp20/alpha crystallin family protein [Methanomicrobiaceae archaeon]